MDKKRQEREAKAKEDRKEEEEAERTTPGRQNEGEDEVERERSEKADDESEEKENDESIDEEEEENGKTREKEVISRRRERWERLMVMMEEAKRRVPLKIKEGCDSRRSKREKRIGEQICVARLLSIGFKALGVNRKIIKIVRARRQQVEGNGTVEHGDKRRLDDDDYGDATKSERIAAKAKAFREGPEGWRTSTHRAAKGNVGGHGGWHRQRFAKKEEKVSSVYFDPTNVVKCSREADGLIFPFFPGSERTSTVRKAKTTSS